MMKIEKKFDKLSNQLIGKAILVHKKIGPGFNEDIYQNALKIELKKAKISFDSEKEVVVNYKGAIVGIHRIDIQAENKMILDLKAVDEITDMHISQVVSCLKASGLNVGLILNFSKSTLEIKRVEYDQKVQQFLKSNVQ